MAVNRRRGEVRGIVDGVERRLCLTLGALAELEDAFAAETISDLARRFSSGALSARDLTRIIGAGLRGGGTDIADEALARLPIEGGAAGAARLAAELLTAAFGGEEARPANP